MTVIATNGTSFSDRAGGSVPDSAAATTASETTSAEAGDGAVKDIEICVVGLGPRGLAVLERLCANLAEHAPGSIKLRLHLVDPHLLTGSRVWNTAQSTELLMNTVTSQITMFLDDSVECAGPVVAGPSLYEWSRFIALIGPFDGAPEQVRTEASRLGPDSYPSRAYYGYYLNWVLRHLIRTAPADISVVLHEQKAIDLVDRADGLQRITLADGSALDRLDAVILAQGHVSNHLVGREAAFADYADRHGLVYIPPANPADVDLDRIGPDQPTVLRGLGLNFFDYLTLLTIGRGGWYDRGRDGRLQYHRSGREPQLIAGSRRGIPHHARGENQKGAFGRHVPLFFTPGVIADLRNRSDDGQPIDFAADVWPLIDAEVRAVYYSTLIDDRLCRCDAATFLRHYVALRTDIAQIAPTRGAEPSPDNIDALEKGLLERFGVTGEEGWNWLRIANPNSHEAFADAADFQAWLLCYLEDDIREAKRGNVDGALAAALDVMRDLRNEIRLVVDHGGLSGDSYRDDLQRWYTPFNAFVSIGPPVERVEQMIALIGDGMLRVVGPGMTVACAPDGAGSNGAVSNGAVSNGAGSDGLGLNGSGLNGPGFVGEATAVPGSAFEATALIEARLPESDIRETSDPLIRKLLERGGCTQYRIPIRTGGSYETGGLAVTRRPYRLLDAERRPHERRFAFGVPTEAAHWVTAAGVRPGVNSVILADADSVARASLVVALQSTAATADLSAE